MLDTRHNIVHALNIFTVVPHPTSGFKPGLMHNPLKGHEKICPTLTGKPFPTASTQNVQSVYEYLHATCTVTLLLRMAPCWLDAVH